MRGTSSWSTDINISRDYASRFTDDKRTRKALFVCEGEQNGTSIQHLAKYPEEREVLCSKDAKWIIIDYMQKNGFDMFTVNAVL